MQTYTGGCHCGAVRFEVEMELGEVLQCNCSHCQMKGLLLVFVDKDKLRVTQGQDNLEEYRFNKKLVQHLFCKTCGVQPFTDNESFPKRAVNVRCLDDVELSKLVIVPYNGKEA